jgi:putative hemolysin
VSLAYRKLPCRWHAILAFGIVTECVQAQSTKVGERAANFDLILLGILVLGLLVLSNAIFVAAETAVGALRNSHVKHAKEELGAKGLSIQDLIEQRQKYLTASLLASRISRLSLFIVVLAVGAAVDEEINHTSSELTSLVSVIPWALVVGIPVLGLNLLVGELIPRSYANLNPHRVGMRLYPAIRGASIFLSLPAQLLISLANLFTARFGGHAAFEGPGPAEEEIKNLVESAEETGEIEADESELIQSVLAFNDTVAREIMTPRVDLDAMPVKASPSEVLKVIRETGHSRIPLYEDSDDQIVGIVHAKDLLLAMEEGSSPSLRKLMRPALFVPEGKSLHELLQEMRANRSQMAVLQDEFGGTAGIVTTEDIVEQLVGEIVDEYDEEELSLMQTGEGWFVNGRLHVDDVNDAIDSSFDGDEFDTIGGLVFGQFGRQPKVGEQVDIDGYEFTVQETDGRRVTRLLIKPSSPQKPENAAESN